MFPIAAEGAAMGKPSATYVAKTTKIQKTLRTLRLFGEQFLYLIKSTDEMKPISDFNNVYLFIIITFL